GFHSQAPGARRRRQRPRQHRGHRRRNSQRRPPPRQAGTEVNRQRLITAKNAKSTKGRGDRRSPRIETPTSLRRGNPPWLPSSSSSNSNFLVIVTLPSEVPNMAELYPYPRFSLAERDRRWAAVRALMRRQNIDVIVTPQNSGHSADYQADTRYL